MLKNIILLFGGDSNEHLVSVASAQAMTHAIKEAKLWFLSQEGAVFAVDQDSLWAHKNPFVDEFIPSSKPLFDDIDKALISSACDDHVFLLGLHGGSGENGDLQHKLEQHGRSYTGSTSKASRIAFDKLATKEALRPYGIRMPPHITLDSHDPDQLKELLIRFLDEHGQIIIKPICGGSSLGCMFARSEHDIDLILKEMATISLQPFFAEKIIVGRELTMGVVEDHHGIKALPCTEIVTEHDARFDYQGKYLGVGTKELTPADLNENVTREVERMAIAVHAALSLDGYSRTDMILAEDGLYFLETNTLPGLTKNSLVPQQLAAANITMREFLLGQIDLAIDRKHFIIS